MQCGGWRVSIHIRYQTPPPPFWRGLRMIRGISCVFSVALIVACTEGEPVCQELNAEGLPVCDDADGSAAGTKTLSSAPDSDCRHSDFCLKYGRCHCPLDSKCSINQAMCVAGDEADCKVSTACGEDGKCALNGEECVAGNSVDCKASSGCVNYGQCTLKDEVCTAGSDADCKASLRCKCECRCKAEDGSCAEVDAPECKPSYMP